MGAQLTLLEATRAISRAVAGIAVVLLVPVNFVPGAVRYQAGAAGDGGTGGSGCKACYRQASENQLGHACILHASHTKTGGGTCSAHGNRIEVTRHAGAMPKQRTVRHTESFRDEF